MKTETLANASMVLGLVAISFVVGTMFEEGRIREQVTNKTQVDAEFEELMLESRCMALLHESWRIGAIDVVGGTEGDERVVNIGRFMKNCRRLFK